MMNNKRLKVIIPILILCIVISYFIGKTINGNSYKVKVKESTTTKIAVVNLDNAVTNNHESINYGKAIVENSKADYVFTNISDAKNGLNKGIYGAYIIIPENFSVSIQSINNTPIKPTIEYKIAKNLTSLAISKVLEGIMDITDNMSSSLGKIYVSAIVSEVHDVQDKSVDIMNRDINDLNALNSIQGLDLTRIIPVPILEFPKNDVPGLDTIEEEQSSKEAMDEVKNKQSARMTSLNSKSEENKLSAEVVTNYVNELESDMNIISDNFKDLSAKIDALKIDTANLQNKYLDLYSKYVLQYTALKNLIDKLPSSSTDLNIQALKDYDYKNLLEDEELEELTHLIAGCDEINPQNGEHIFEESINVKVSKLGDDFTNAVLLRYSSIVNNIVNIKTSVENLNNLLDMFNGDDYNIANDLEQMITKVNTNNSSIKGKISKHDSDYSSYVSKVESSATKNLNTLQEYIRLSQEENQKALDSALDSAKITRNENNKNNELALNSFTAKLPYTRIGSKGNLQTIDFIAAPISINNRSGVVEDKEVTVKNKKNVLPIILIAIFIALMALAIVVYKKQHKRSL